MVVYNKHFRLRSVSKAFLKRIPVPIRVSCISLRTADVSTLDNIVADLLTMDCSPAGLEMDRGFFSVENLVMMVGSDMGFTVPVPARLNISKLLFSESAKDIDSPLNTDYLAKSVVRGYETCVRLDGGGW